MIGNLRHLCTDLIMHTNKDLCYYCAYQIYHLIYHKFTICYYVKDTLGHNQVLSPNGLEIQRMHSTILHYALPA